MSTYGPGAEGAAWDTAGPEGAWCAGAPCAGAPEAGAATFN